MYHKYSTFEEAAEACKQHNLATRIATDKSIQSSLAVNNALEVLETGGHIEFLVLALLLTDDIINNIKRVPLPSKRIHKRMYNSRNGRIKLVPQISRNTRPLAFVRSVIHNAAGNRGFGPARFKIYDESTMKAMRYISETSFPDSVGGSSAKDVQKKLDQADTLLQRIGASHHYAGPANTFVWRHHVNYNPVKDPIFARPKHWIHLKSWCKIARHMILRRDSVNNDDLKRLPHDVVMKILKFHPLIIPPFTNNVLRRAVKDYIAGEFTATPPRGGGDRKQRIVDKYGEISNWDVSKVTNMERLFAQSSFNQPLNNWDVSNVKYMSEMFECATSFNQPLDEWNVSNVCHMEGMFEWATSFNQSLDKWDVSKVCDMRNMFHFATSFNKPLFQNVSNVINMNDMFEGATSFNQSLDNWDVSNVKKMGFMFQNATSFNQPLNNWNVSKVTDMYRMFGGATSFNQPLDNWNVSKVHNTDMRFMFANATSFNQTLHAPWYEDTGDY